MIRIISIANYRLVHQIYFKKFMTLVRFFPSLGTDARP